MYKPASEIYDMTTRRLNDTYEMNKADEALRHRIQFLPESTQDVQ